jgi:excisionase family DNA binding protein
MKEDAKEILTVAEVAELLRCSKANVERALQGTLSGVPRMAHVVLGKHKVVRREWLQEWMDNSRAS